MSTTWSPLIKLCIQAMDDEDNHHNQQYLQKFVSLVNVTAESGSTPLHFVALGKNTQLTKWLLENGAIVMTNEDCQTPLHYACRNGNVSMVQILLNHMSKEQIIIKDWEGTTALDWAKEYEFNRIISLIEQKISDKKQSYAKSVQKKLHKRIPAFTLLRTSVIRS